MEEKEALQTTSYFTVNTPRWFFWSYTNVIPELAGSFGHTDAARYEHSIYLVGCDVMDMSYALS
jgi:hypothetical protein